MSIGTESVVKQIVLSPSAFGPNEIVQIVGAIGKSYSNYRELREASAELEEQPNRSPATSARLGVCLYLLGRYSDAVETLAHSDGGALTHFYLGKAYLALDKYAEALTAYESAERAGYSRDQVALAKAEALRYNGRRRRRWRCSTACPGAVEQTAEYLYQRAATVSALGGNPSEVGRALGAGRRGRRQSRRRAVRPGARERSPRQRQLRPRAVRAGGDAVSDARRHAAEPGRACTKTCSTTKRRGNATSGFWTCFPTIRGPGCSARTPTRRATCTTTKTRDAARTGSARCSAFRSPISNCRSAAATACKRWAS